MGCRGRRVDLGAVADAMLPVLEQIGPAPLLPIYLALRKSGAIDCSYSSADKAVKLAVAERRIEMKRFDPQGIRLFSAPLRSQCGEQLTQIDECTWMVTDPRFGPPPDPGKKPSE